MDRFADLDVSLAMTTISAVDGADNVLFETSVGTDATTIAEALAAHRPALVSLEAGPTSESLHDGLTAQGIETVLLVMRSRTSSRGSTRECATKLARILPADG